MMPTCVTITATLPSAVGCAHRTHRTSAPMIKQHPHLLGRCIITSSTSGTIYGRSQYSRPYSKLEHVLAASNISTTTSNRAIRCSSSSSGGAGKEASIEDVESDQTLLYEEQLEKARSKFRNVETFSHVIPPEEANVEHKRRLVLAVDNLSKTSEAACTFLIDNVCREGDIVHLVHVVPFQDVQRCEPVMVMSDEDPYQVVCVPDDQMVAHMKENTEAMLDTLGARFVEAKFPVECDVVIEKTSEAVCKVLEQKVEELDATMLVISTKTQSGVEAFFLGSISSYCVRHCDCPVMVLHGK